MVAALFDTNILIDYLAGIREAQGAIAFDDDPSISIITWMEVLVEADRDLQAPTLAFLARFRVMEIDLAIARRAVTIRRERRLKLPDAIIWATAQTRSLLLVTRNSRDFPESEPGIRLPYRLA